MNARFALDGMLTIATDAGTQPDRSRSSGSKFLRVCKYNSGPNFWEISLKNL